MEQSIERSLPYDADGNFEVSLVDANGASHAACLISGFEFISTLVTIILLLFDILIDRNAALSSKLFK